MRLRAVFDPRRFNRQPHALDADIEALWARKTAANPRVFDAPKFRCAAAERAADGALELSLGLTSYRDFVGTNLAGAEACAARGDAALAHPLGVGAVVRTADGFVLLQRRSAHVAELPGALDLPGGHPEPSRVADLADAAAVEAELADAIRCEARDEVNLDVAAFEALEPLGVVWQEHSGGRPSLQFLIRTAQRREEVAAGYVRGGAEAEESTLLVFLPVATVGGDSGDSGELRVDAVAPDGSWSELSLAEVRADLTPSARGALEMCSDRWVDGGTE